MFIYSQTVKWQTVLQELYITWLTAPFIFLPISVSCSSEIEEIKVSIDTIFAQFMSIHLSDKQRVCRLSRIYFLLCTFTESRFWYDVAFLMKLFVWALFEIWFNYWSWTLKQTDVLVGPFKPNFNVPEDIVIKYYFNISIEEPKHSLFKFQYRGWNISYKNAKNCPFTFDVCRQ